jgi:hypothetical protein
MGLGQTGKYDRNTRRFVREGGIIRYGGRVYQDAQLLPYVNTEVLVNEIGWCPEVDIYECWYPYGTARGRWQAKNKPVWVKGSPIVIDLEPLPLKKNR